MSVILTLEWQDHCVFVHRGKEGPERMGQFAQGRSLHFKVGPFTLPPCRNLRTS